MIGNLQRPAPLFPSLNTQSHLASSCAFHFRVSANEYYASDALYRQRGRACHCANVTCRLPIDRPKKTKRPATGSRSNLHADTQRRCTRDEDTRTEAKHPRHAQRRTKAWRRPREARSIGSSSTQPLSSPFGAAPFSSFPEWDRIE